MTRETEARSEGTKRENDGTRGTTGDAAVGLVSKPEGNSRH